MWLIAVPTNTVTFYLLHVIRTKRQRFPFLTMFQRSYLLKKLDASLQVTHAISYPSPVLSMAISPDCATLAVGMANGMLAVKRHAKPTPVPGARAPPPKAPRKVPRLTAASYKYFLRGQSSAPSADDFLVRAQRRVKLAAFDRQLRRFRYKEALDSALTPGQPEVVASVLQELASRAALSSALSAPQA